MKMVKVKIRWMGLGDIARNDEIQLNYELEHQYTGTAIFFFGLI